MNFGKEAPSTMVRASWRHSVALVLGSLAILVVGSGAGAGRHGWHTASGAEERSARSALPTVVVLPDTQYYASSFPEILADQTRWIVDQKVHRNIAVAIHLGDIVDSATDRAQWQVADSALRILDGRVPYVLVPGNHDTDANRVGMIDDYFAPSTMPWIAGTMAEGRIENNYTLVDIGSRQWLILGLEFGPRDTTLAWADSILKTYPTQPAIIVTHAYLYEDGSRYGMAGPGLADPQPTGQRFAPEAFGYTRNEGINDGERIWQKLIMPNRNVRLVLCGHDNGVSRLSTFRPDGSLVHQVLSDYQWLYQGTADYAGGSGFLRLLEFDYRKKVIRVRTYSPYLNRYLFDDANEFTLSLDL